MDKLFLIDGHALVFKMYYAFLRRPMINSKGADMSILYGFTKYLLEMVEREKPTHLAVAFDPPGVTFPAKFDRRHILNATASLTVADNEKRSIALTGLFTLQSGHWETVAAGEYPAVTFFGQQYALDYFTSVNNYEMPPYIRLDLGCSFKFKTRHPQELNLGIYNVLNRHNPFSIIYDDRSREWRQVSLLPIMPSFNYQVTF